MLALKLRMFKTTLAYEDLHKKDKKTKQGFSASWMMPIDPSLYLGFQVSHLYQLGTGFDSLISKTVNLSELDGPFYAATFAGAFRYGIPADPEEDKAIKYPLVLMAAANTRSRKTRIAAEI